MSRSSRCPFRSESRSWLVVFVAAAAVLATTMAYGQEQFQGTSSSDYTNPANWSSGYVPGTAGDPTDGEMYIGHNPSYNDLTAIYNSATSYSTNGRFTIGWNYTGTLTMNGSAGTLSFGGNGGSDYVGVDGGTGTLNIDAGAVQLNGQNLNIGVNNAVATGTVNVAGGTLYTSGTIYMGTGATGDTGSLNIGTGSSVTATGGTHLQNGEITVSGGTFTSTGTIDVGYNGAGGGTAAYTQTGGTVATNQFVTGAYGTTNTTSISGGSVTAAFYVGGYGGGGGLATVNLSGTGLISGGFDFGGGGTNAGVFNLNGGTLSATRISNDAGGGASTTFNFNGGVLQANGGAITLGSVDNGIGAINVLAGGAILDSNGYAITIDRPMLGSAGDGGVTKNGLGTLTLSASNTFNGGVTVNNGTLNFNGTDTSSTGNISVTNGALNFNAAYSTTGSLTMTAGTVTIAATADLDNPSLYNLNGGTLVTPAIPTNGLAILNFNGGTLQASATTGSFMMGLASANVLAGGANISTNGFSVTIVQPLLSGATNDGGLTKSGTGALTLAGANTYNGATNITGGTLQLGNANAVQNSTVNLTVNNSLTFSAGFDAPNIGGLSGTANLLLQDLAGSPAAVTPVIGGNNATTAYSGILSGTGGITKAGTGGLTLSGANSYTGATTVNAGTLTLSGSAAAGTLTTSGITANGGSFAFTPTTATVLALGGSSTLTLNGGNLNLDIDASTATVPNDEITTGTLSITANSSISFSTIGAVTSGATYTLATYTTLNNPGSFTVAGENIGKLTLDPVVGANAITVTPTLLQAVWNSSSGGNWSTGPWLNYTPGIAGDAALFGSALTDPTGQIVLTQAESVGFMTFNNTTSSYTIGTPGSSFLTLDNGSSPALVAVQNGGSHTIAENTTLNSNLVVSTDPTATLTISGALSDGTNGPSSLTKIGTGTLNLTGLNAYSGGTNVNAGLMAVSGSGTLGATTGALSVLSAATLDLGTTIQTVGAVSLSGGTIQNGTLRATSFSSTGGTVTAGLGGTGTLTEVLGTLVSSGPNSYTGGTILTGGTVTLSGTNSTTGSTTVNAGALLNINGVSALGTGPLVINGGTLDNTSGSAIINTNINAETWAGSFTFTGSNNLDLGTGAVSIGGTTPTVTVMANTLTVGGISGTGGLTTAGAGAGTLAVSGASTYTGQTSVTSGTLSISGSLGATGPGAGNIEVTGGGNLIIAGNVTQAGGEVFSAGSANAGVSTTGTVTVNSGTVTLGGTSGGVTGVVFVGGGVGGQANYSTGVLTINGGTVIVGPSIDGGPGSLDTNRIWLDPYSNDGPSTLNLNGGVLSTARPIQDGSGGNSVVNFNGGTVQAAFANTNASIFNALNVYVLANGATIDTQANTDTIGSPLQHGGSGTDGGLTKIGVGTLIAASNQSYDGPTLVSAGTLQVNGTNSALGGIGSSSGLTIANGATVIAGGADNGLRGTGATALPITVNTGATLTAASTFTNNLGPLTLAGGTLTGPTATGDALTAGTWNFDGGVTAGGVPATATATISAPLVSLSQTGGTVFYVSPATAQTIAGVDLNVTSVLAHTSAPDTGLIKTGTGVMVLNGADTYTGPTTINAGTLILNGSAAGTLTTSAIAMNGGTFTFTPGSTSTLTMPTGSTLSFGGGNFAVDLGNAGVSNVIAADMLSLTANGSTISATMIGAFSSGTPYTVATFNTLTNSGPYTLSPVTVGQLTLTPAILSNSITITPTLNQGVWNNVGSGNWSTPSTNWTNYTPTNAGDAALFGSVLTSNATVTVDVPEIVGYITFNNPTYSYTIGNPGSSNLTLNNGSALADVDVIAGSQPMTIAENVALASNVDVSTDPSTSLLISGVISGTGMSLTKSGTGTLTLSGANLYDGGTNIQNGSVVLSSGTNRLLSTGSVVLGGVGTSGTLVLGDSNGAVSQTLAGLTSTGGGGSVVGGNASNSTLTLNLTSGTSVFAGTLGGAGTYQNNLALVVSGTGAVALSGNNTFAGGTTLNAGQLNVNSANALGTGTLTINGGTLDNTSGGAIINANNNAQTWAGNFTFAGSNNLDLGSGAVALGSTTPTITVSANTLTVDGAIGGTGGIIKAGPGTLTLTGAETYSGRTTVTGGTLNIATSGSFASANSIDVYGGGNLNIAGTVTMASNTAFGVGSGVQGTTGTATVAAGATLNVGAGGGLVFIGGDFLNAAGNGRNGAYGTGTLNVNGTMNVAAGGGGPGGLDGGSLWLDPYSNSGPSTLNLNVGGTLTTARNINDGSNGNSVVNFNGGTLQAAVSTTALFGGLLNLKVLAGGAIIDTNGFNDSITLGLVHGSGTPDGGLTKIGLGTLTLSGVSAVSTYTGATTVNAGTLSIGASNGQAGELSGTPRITVNNGGTLSIGSMDALGYTIGVAALTINNGGTVTTTAGVRQTIVNNITMTGGTLSSAAGNGDGSGDYSLNNVGFVATSDPTTGSPAVVNATSFSEEMSNTNLTFNVTRGVMAPVSDLNVSSAIIPYVLQSTPNTGITKTGNGIMTLSGESTYTGSTLISGGTLRVANASGGSATSTGTVTVNTGGTLAGSLSPNQGFIAGAVSVSSGGAIGGSNGDTLTLSGGLTLAGGAGLAFNLTGSPSANPLIATTGGGGTSLAISGTDAITLSGTPSGGTYDLISFSNSTAPTSSNFTLPTAPSGTIYAMNITSSQLDLIVATALTWTDNSVSFPHSWDTTTQNNWAIGNVNAPYADGDSVVFNDTNATGGTPPNGTVYVQAGGVAPLSATFDNSSVSYVLSNVGGDLNGIKGTATVAIQGPGTVTFNSPNLYSGVTTISGGSLQLGSANAVQYSTVSIGVANGLTFTPSIGNGTFLLGGLSGTANESLQDTGGGAVNLQVGGNDANTAYSGSLSGIGSLTMAGTGVLTLSGANGYTGGTTIQSGTLRAGAANTLPTTGTVTFGVGSSAGTLDLNGYGLTVGGLAVTAGANAADQIITNSNTSNVGSTATLIYAGATPSTFGGTLKDGSNGLLALTVSSGALTLTGTNSYSGATSVNGGSLRVNGSLGSSSAVTVTSGASLGGSGTVNGLVTVAASGHLAPSVGTVGGTTSLLTLTNGLTLADNSVLDMNLANIGLGSDLINLTGGNLSLGNNGILNFNGSLNNGDYPLIDFTGELTNTDGSNWNVVNHPNDSGHSYSFMITTGTSPSDTTVNQFDLVVSTSNVSGTWNSSGSDSSSMDYGTAANWLPAVGSSPAVPNGIGLIATFGTGSQLTVSVNGAYTVGQLNFNGSIPSASYYLTGNGSLTLNNSGSGASVNVSSGGLSPAIATTLVLADASLTTTFNVASGSSLDLSGTINESTPTGQQIVLSGGGVLTMEGSNNFTGGTTIQNGTLVANASGVLGTGSLTFNPGSGNTAALDVNTSMTVNNLSEPSTSLGTAQLNVASSTTLTLNQTASATFAGTLSLGGSAALTLNQGSGNTLTISGAPTLASLSSVLVNSGTLALTNNTNSPATVVGSASVSVASGATLQLAGSQAALSSAVNITTQGSGSAGDGALMVVGTTNQTVGIVSGNTVGSGPVTMYSGNTTVGDGTNAANLTATQILQNTLTINAGSTVTIAPSGSGIQTEDDVSTATALSAVASSAATADSGSDSSSDPFTAIQAAIASGSISSAKGEQLENRITEIEQLATTDPGLDVSILEDRVLAMLPSPSVWSSSGAGSSSSPLGETGSGLLAVDSSTFGSSSDSTSGSAAAAFAPSAAFGGNPAAVPEPSTLLLAALAGLGFAIAARRRPNSSLLQR